MFMLMGSFVSYGGIGDEAYKMAKAWFGHIKGGLAIATIGACGLFAGYRAPVWPALWSWVRYHIRR